MISFNRHASRLFGAAAIALMAASAASIQGAAAQEVPAGYPAGYSDVISAAKQEANLLIYSNMSQKNWQHVIAAFSERYPGISVDMLDLGSREAIERYLAETSTSARTADLIVTASQPGWIDLHRRDQILDYASPESEAWPDWSKPYAGLYTISTDPLTFAWNNLELPEDKRPRTFAQFAEMAKENKDAWSRKITSYSPIESPFGYAAHWAFVKHHGDVAWEWLSALGELPVQFEATGGPQVEKVTNGEYVGSYFMSAIQVWPRTDDPAQARFLGWNFIEDGQPLMLRGAGIPKGAKNLNAAKLMLDLLLSADGQRAFGQGGLTPARPDVTPGDGVRHTLSSITEAVGGEENIILIGYDDELVDGYEAFQKKLAETFKQ